MAMGLLVRSGYGTHVMHVHVLQYDIVWEDKAASQARMESLLERRPPAPGSLLLTPEMGDVGFSFNLDRIVDERSLEWAMGIARQYDCFVQHGYAELAPDGRGLNTASIVDPSGSVLGQYRKVHPFSYGGEIKHYAPGDRLQLIELGGLQCCPMICYDLRFPELWRLARRAGADVFTIGASWPAARSEHWRALLIARAIENQAYVVACNRTGSDPHLDYAGGSMIISPRGEILAEAGIESMVIQAELDPEAIRSWRDTMRCQDDVNDRFLGAIDIDHGPRA